MKLTLQRQPQDPKSTPGDLALDGQPFGFTLELPIKDGLPGSAIPAGTYRIELQPSPRFMASVDPWVKQFASKMPHLVDIPSRSLIMIHWLNNVTQTDGCIGVGETRTQDFIGNSRAAFEKLYAVITSALEQGQELSIEILDAPTNHESVNEAINAT